MTGPAVRKETTASLSYKVNGSTAMTDQSLVRARDVCSAAIASPLLNMVRDLSATVIAGASRIPFVRSSRIRRPPWHCRSSTVVEQALAVRKREDEVFLSRFVTYCRSEYGWELSMASKGAIRNSPGYEKRSVERMRRILSHAQGRPAQQLKLLEVSRISAATTGMPLRHLVGARKVLKCPIKIPGPLFSPWAPSRVTLTAQALTTERVASRCPLPWSLCCSAHCPYVNVETKRKHSRSGRSIPQKNTSLGRRVH